MGADPLEPLGQLVERARAAAAAADRSDLVERLSQTSRRLTHQGIRALVVGEFKQGKSLLVNAMVNAPICAVDDDIATSVPTMVRHGERSKATLVYAPPEVALEAVHRGRSERSGSSDDPDAAGQEIELIREPIEVLKVAQVVGEAANPGNQRRLAYAEVELPRTLLTGGLVLVDTPGVGGIGSAHHGATMAILPTADLVLLVTDASQELTAPEIDFLRQAQSLCPNVACVLTKTDLYPHWRRDRSSSTGITSRRWVARRSRSSRSPRRCACTPSQHSNRELNEDSGFPALMAYLRNEVLNKRGPADPAFGRQRRALRRSTPRRHRCNRELTALRDPENQRKIVPGLEAARPKADALRQADRALAAGPQRRDHRPAV